MKQNHVENAIDRIAEMERIFDTLTAALASQGPAVTKSPVFCALLRRLADYYESPRWREDYALDEAGLLPREMKRGVLSEDGIYNFLSDLDNIRSE